MRRSIIGTQLWRTLVALLLALCAFANFAHAPAAHADTTAKVAYITDFGAGVNDPKGPRDPGPIAGSLQVPGSNVFRNAIDGLGHDTGPGTATYTPTGGVPTTFTDVTIATIDANPAVLGGYDTLLLYEVCSIGDAGNATAMTAINNFLKNGGKVFILAADRCTASFGGPGNADYSTFLFPFATDAPGPAGDHGKYTSFIPTTLNAGVNPAYADNVDGLPDSHETDEDAMGDANVFTSNQGNWCVSIKGTNGFDVNDIVQGYARTAAGGLAIYEGEDFWYTWGPRSHLKQVFDAIINQMFHPDGLPCGLTVTGVTLTPGVATNLVGTSHTVTATVTDANTGLPLAGHTVSFVVTSGPNAGATGTGVTDVNGQATFTYSDSGGAGTDTIVATDTATGKKSNEAFKTWTPPIKPPPSATPEAPSAILFGAGIALALVALRRRGRR